MKTLIVYQTMHGCTEKCAGKLQAGLQGEVDLVNLKKNKKVNPANYDTVIIGGSIHAGRIQGGIKKFCAVHEEILLQKKLCLFICCMDDKTPQQEFDANFPEPLRNHAAAKRLPV